MYYVCTYMYIIMLTVASGAHFISKTEHLFEVKSISYKQLVYSMTILARDRTEQGYFIS